MFLHLNISVWYKLSYHVTDTVLRIIRVDIYIIIYNIIYDYITYDYISLSSSLHEFSFNAVELKSK